MSIIDFAASQGWAMLKERADELVQIVADHADGVAKDPSVLEAYRAKTADRAERATVRDGVGMLYIDGPLFKKANLFVEFSGATSYQILRRDLQVLVDDPNIHSILMCIDSPGGEANGCDELAKAIFEARSAKPITAYVSGMAASGGYWLASAATRIVVSEAALLGSIGVVLGIQDRKVAEERRGVRTIEFVSSQSPGKRPDPSTDDGRNRIQTMVDDLAEVFISAVAQYRGVSVEDVIKNFGAGGMKIGAKAVASGMADEVGQLEATIASLISSGRKGRFIPRSPGGLSMSENNNGPTADEIAAKARTDANNRTKAILTCDDGKLMPTAANFLAFETNLSAEDSVKFLAAVKADFPKAPAAGAAGREGEKPADTTAKSFVEHKQNAGALGLAEPPADGKAVAKAAWGEAVAAANRGIH